MDEQSRAGDGPAADAAALFARVERPLRGYLRRLLQQEADVDDVLQETWMRALGSADLCRDESSVRAFLFRIATNVAFDRLRRQRTRGSERSVDGLELESLDPRPDHLAELDRSMLRVQQALHEMDDRCREVFLLRARDQFTYEEIAARLGVGKRTVERAMHDALELCQAKLRD